jgi:hypothetical protein
LLQPFMLLLQPFMLLLLLSNCSACCLPPE